jgi:pseudouridine-5'-phosphate glycosidase/sugar/nucleoside kinase (ribokinase family)
MASRQAIRHIHGSKLLRRYPRSFSSFNKPPTNSSIFQISDEVREALATGSKPVVALESTIYTHGFPSPQNLELARLLENIVRENGGVPATIAILNGVARVGLSKLDLEELLDAKNVNKVSRRDLAYTLGASGYGGTTISGTMILARKAGIKIFATGGLGGVHRGGENSMDVSADLTELGRTPVAVVASGCKGFLDIQRTLEYLETQGVPVATFADGRNAGTRVDFPAFWVRDSGFKSPMTVENTRQAAELVHAQFNELGVDTGILFANPIPTGDAIPKALINECIEEAVLSAEKAGAAGKDNTPWVLSKILELTQGKSLVANKSLVSNNVKTGTLIAGELLEIEKSKPAPKTYKSASIQREDTDQITVAADALSEVNPLSSKIIVAGALAVDFACDYAPFDKSSTTPSMHTSNPASISSALGGVGYNVAKAAKLLQGNISFCSMVGNDMAGNMAMEELKAQGFDKSGVFRHGSNLRTSQYVAVNDSNRDLVLAMADMGMMEQPEPQFHERWASLVENTKPKWVALDANWSADSISQWLDLARKCNARTAFEPVSVAKSKRLFPPLQKSPDGNVSTYPNHRVDIATPCEHELAAMFHAARENGYFDSAEWFQVIDSFRIPASGLRDRLVKATSEELVDQGIPQQAIQLLPWVPCMLTTLGRHGVLLTMLIEPDDKRFSDPKAKYNIVTRGFGSSEPRLAVYMKLVSPEEVLGSTDIVSVNGAGDTFLGALLAKLATAEEDASIEDAIQFGQRAAACTLKSKDAVSHKLPMLLK